MGTTPLLKGETYASARQWRGNATSESQSVSQSVLLRTLLQLTFTAVTLLFSVLILSRIFLFLATAADIATWLF